MDLLNHYRQLASYDGWANQETVRVLRDTGNPPAKSVRWLGHVLAAEHLWIARLLHRTSPLPVWPDLSLDQCATESDSLLEAWSRYLRPDLELGATVDYENSKKEFWTSSVADILTHVFMHSAYHRGQIAADLRQSGYTPVCTDFIHGVRQGLVGSF